MRFAKFNTTTLNRPGEAHIPVEDIRQSFEQFEQQWVKARRVVEVSSASVSRTLVWNDADSSPDVLATGKDT